MYSIAKDWDNLNFDMCKYSINYAQMTDQAYRGHVLVWASGSNNPKFINEATDAAQLETFLKMYITKTVTELGPYVQFWDVVNEYVCDDCATTKTDTVWAKVPDFSCTAFKTAKAASPDALLMYNDYNMISNVTYEKTKSDKVYTYIKDLVDRNCGIDGIGFQAHVQTNFPAGGYEGFRTLI
jgi:endo-1,4-beta-xylanase